MQQLQNNCAPKPRVQGADDDVRSGHQINNLKFADDIDLLEEDWQENLKQISEAGEAAGLKVNRQKTMRTS